MNKSEEKLPVQLNTKPFKGYSIDQLRYQLVYTSLQKEFCKEKFLRTMHSAVEATPFGSGKKSKSMAFGGSIIQSVLKGLSYADYAIVGFSAFKTVRSIFSLFRRKKK